MQWISATWFSRYCLKIKRVKVTRNSTKSMKGKTSITTKSSKTMISLMCLEMALSLSLRFVYRSSKFNRFFLRTSHSNSVKIIIITIVIIIKIAINSRVILNNSISRSLKIIRNKRCLWNIELQMIHRMIMILQGNIRTQNLEMHLDQLRITPTDTILEERIAIIIIFLLDSFVHNLIL